MTAPTRQQRRAAARTAPREPVAEGVFGLLSEKQQRERLYAALIETQQMAIQTQRLVHETVEAAFAAKWDAKFRELDDLRNQCARALPLIVKAGLLTQTEINKALRDE